MTPAAATATLFRADELSLLADFSQAIAVSIDIETTLREAVQRIAKYMQAEAAALFLLEGDHIRCRASFGRVDIRGLTLPKHKGIVGRTIRDNQVQLVPDVQHDPDFAGNLVSGFIARTMVCAPLSTADGPIGALQLLNRIDGEAFGTHDANFLRLFAAPTALALNNARLAGELLEQDRIKREFAVARQMQKELLPRRQRDSPVHGVNLPAREVSGDFYDFFPLSDGKIAFFIGDVSGKGMDAAMLMVRTSALLRLVGKDRLRPSPWLAKVNQELAGTLSRGFFVCVLAGTYDPSTGLVEFASAGIPPAVHRFADGSAELYCAGGPPLGILSDAQFVAQRCCIAGGSWYCFTDGFTDIRDPQGGLIGVEGARALIESVQGLSPRARLRGILGQARKMSLPDDTTILMLADDSDTPRLIGGLCCPSDPIYLKSLRHAVSDALEALNVSAAAQRPLVLAIDEACANVIRHAYAGTPDGRLALSIWLEGATIVFHLQDWAAPVDCSKIKPRDLSETRPGGLGVNLIDQVMDEWGFAAEPRGCGNLWIAKKILRRGMQTI